MRGLLMLALGWAVVAPGDRFPATGGRQSSSSASMGTCTASSDGGVEGAAQTVVYTDIQLGPVSGGNVNLPQYSSV